MIDTLNEMREVINSTLIREMSDYDYRYTRYNINYSIAIGYVPEEIDLNHFASFIRKTDRFITIEPNICAIILDCADCTDGLKTANNLLTIFNKTFFSKKIFAGVATANEHPSSISFINELYYLLKFGIANNMDNQILDSSQLFKDH